MRPHRLPVLARLLALALVAATPAAADTTYRVTVTNTNRAQPLSPPVVAVHDVAVHLYAIGSAASEGLRLVAEEGDTSILVAELEATPGVLDVAVGQGPLMPGQSTTVEVVSRGRAVFLSLVSMLGSTNDAFVGLDAFYLPGMPWARTVGTPAYDAGTERNSEDCDFVLGPPCFAAGARDTAGAEGRVQTHNGIHGSGDLDPAVWDFRFPAAQVTIVRLSGGD